ncbi:MAG: hypothetical protein E6767_03520 [Dysgonomonas sp.]|nr:hypothetical protein [Dysgonomonas sp.]
MNNPSDLAIVVIICPICNKKARFRSPWNNLYRRNPEERGIVTCTYCGTAKKYSLSNLKYYYAIEIKNRHLVARNRENLIGVYNHFKNREKINDDPDMDYPKVFYSNRDKLLQKIEELLQNHDE